MAATHLERVVRRDRRIVAICILGVAALAWVYLVVVAKGSNGVAAANVATRGETEFALSFVMWAVMMLGMMLPSASPMILMFARINQDRRSKNAPFIRTAVFVTGYIVVWSAFSLAATALQWSLQGTGLLSPMLATTNTVLGGVVLLAAGLYQLTPLKNACLRQCQSPLGFLMTRWREGHGGAFRMGLSHGAYCVGCCWGLMALLFVVGVMNLAWVAALAIFVLMEKIVPPSRHPARLAGAALIGWGGWMMMGTIF